MHKTDYQIAPYYEIFYIDSMLFSTTSAVQSLICLSDMMPTSAATEPELDDDVLNHLQNVVLQGGSISRYFFPSRGGHEARGELLRKACGVTDESPLKTRDLRNSLEHFDERLDLYLANDVFGRIIPQYVGPEPVKDNVPCHIFRAYYTDTDIFELLGTRYQFGPIASELIRVHRELHRCSENGGRLVPPK